METDSNIKTETKKKPSAIENIGKVGMEVGEKLGKAVTEWFTGKPPSEEEKIRRKRLRELKSIQEEAQYQNDLELARRGEYVPPVPKETKKSVKKDEGLDIFKNLGKYNPLEDFNKNKSLGSHDFGVEKYGSLGSNKSPNVNIDGYGDRNPHKSPDFGLEGFAGTTNPMETKRRR